MALELYANVAAFATTITTRIQQSNHITNILLFSFFLI